MKPHSLVYEEAVSASAGFPEIEVAFVESMVTNGPKLLSCNPVLDDVPALWKAFTPTLGLCIAPRKYPYRGGTAGLDSCLSKNDNRVAVLTYAHMVRPPPVSAPTYV